MVTIKDIQAAMKKLEEGNQNDMNILTPILPAEYDHLESLGVDMQFFIKMPLRVGE